MEHCFTLKKDAFADLFKIMSDFGEVWAPVHVSEQSFSFQHVTDHREVALEALRTILPPKKIFYPQRETLIKYEGQAVSVQQPDARARVLFGVHPCDLHGLGIMDSIFYAQPQDSHYVQRRQATMIIGLSCMPDKHCFCQSMGTDSLNSSYDIFLTDIGYDFFVQVNTPLGCKLIDGHGDLIKPALSQDKQNYKSFWSKRDEAFTVGFRQDNLPAIVDMEWDNPIWEELGKRCLSCGNCTPVCPTCYCFDILDLAQVDGQVGERIREWDSCQLNGFAQVSGGFNFRPGPVDRLKFWYRHKLHGFDDPYGFPTCVGCGRCTVSCPSGIDDIVGVVLRLQGEGVGQKDDTT